MSFADDQGSCVPDGASVFCSTVTSEAVSSGTLTGPFTDCNNNTYTATEPALGKRNNYLEFLTAPLAGYPLGQVGEIDALTAHYVTDCPGGVVIDNALSAGSITGPSDCTPFTLSPSATTASGSCAGQDYSFTFTISAIYGCSVSFPKPIRNEDTPRGMNDRIPPKKETIITIKVQLASTCKQVYLRSQGRPQDGSIKIDGSYKEHLKAPFNGSLNIKVKGVNQTRIGRGAHLTLIAEDDSQSPPVVIAHSKPFAVSAIPVSVSESFIQGLTLVTINGVTVPGRGMEVLVKWSADANGDLTTLNGVCTGELLSYSKVRVLTTGLDRVDPIKGFTTDVHFLDLSLLRSSPDGLVDSEKQVMVFIDQRADPTAHPTSCARPESRKVFGVPASGYHITFTLSHQTPNHRILTVKKSGVAETVLAEIDETGVRVRATSGAGKTDPLTGITHPEPV
jgi:hypothetical protein